MFSCDSCDKRFARSDSLLRHQQGYCSPVSNLCEVCGVVFTSAGHFVKHQKEKHGLLKRKLHEVQPSGRSKKICMENVAQSDKQSDLVKCRECNIYVQKKYLTQHCRSLQHKDKARTVKGVGISLIKQAFKNRIVTYSVNTDDNKTYINVDEFLTVLKPKVFDCVQTALQKYVTITINLELFGLFILQAKEVKEVKSFNSKFKRIDNSVDFDAIYQDFIGELDNRISEFQEKDSGWALERLLFLELDINKYNPLKASSYIPLPKSIEQKKAVINIQNVDDKCFMWSVLAALYPANYHAERVTNYTKYENELNFKGIELPVKLRDIDKFEKQNSISVNVYGLEWVYKDSKADLEIVGPLHFTSNKQETHVNLLLIDDGVGNSHYCLIKDLPRLVRSQLSKHKTKKFICDGCLINFTTESGLREHQAHDCNHIKVILPTSEPRIDKYGNTVPGNVLKFESFEKKIDVPFVVYADFESLLLPIQHCQQDNEEAFTEKTHIHQSYSFGYYIKCSYDDSLSKYVTYRGVDCAEVFCKRLDDDVKTIYNKHLKSVVPMIPLTEEENAAHIVTSICHICEGSFGENDEKIHDHCHLTGHYRGPAHSNCNINYKIPNFIPIFFHNLSNYDAHLFIKGLGLGEEKIDVIAENKEKYISFSKHLQVDQIKTAQGKTKNVYIRIRFLDSFRFMASSLDELAKNLRDDQCRTTRTYFSEDSKFKLIRQKGVFPYSFANSFDKLNYAQLPTRKDFFDNLRNEEVSEADYQRAGMVWETFGCKTLGEYSDLYLMSDVLLLSDIFETFRGVCKSVYGLDPAHFFTAPGLSWSAMLKITKIELDLLSDIDMIHFIKKGIRGGVSQCSKRYLKANNKFVPNYDSSKPASFINYLDATNLYGKALSAHLPFGDFRFLTETEITELDLLNAGDDSETGYLFEVDLEYPEKLHDAHNDLPFCPENVIPPGSKLSKLIPNLNNKIKYVIHYRNLQQCLAAGLILTKVHRVLSFKQSAWLKRYIDLNTRMRNADTTEFGKMFYKLMNNSVFGKTMENVDKRTDIRLVTHWENKGRRLGAEALMSKPNFKDRTIFTNSLVAIHMEKLSICYDKPIYVGFCVLDLSKHVMYDFYYNFIKDKYGDNVTLAYHDTDSLVLLTYTENFYEDIKNNLDKYDTSNFEEGNQFGIPKTVSVIGKMKDEYGGKILREFVGTGAKAYVTDAEGELSKTAKGIQKNVTKNELTLENYKAAVFNNAIIYKNVRTFRSHNHLVYTELKNKIALSWKDDKRYIIPDGSGETLAWGHYKLRIE